MKLGQALLANPTNLLNRIQYLQQKKKNTSIYDTQLAEDRIPLVLQQIATYDEGKVVSKKHIQQQLGIVNGLNEAFDLAVEKGLLRVRPVGNRREYRRTDKEHTA